MAVGVIHGTVIVAGGGIGESTSATVEAYDPASDVWTTLGNMPAARKFATAVTYNDTLYIFGGLPALGRDAPVTSTYAVELTPCPEQHP